MATLNKAFTTVNVPVSSDSLMIANNLGNNIFNVAKYNFKLIDVTGNIPTNVLNVAGADKAFKDKDFYLRLAYSMQNDINLTGGNLKEEYYKENTKLFNTLFLLCGLAYVSVDSKDGGSGRTDFLATKNDVVLNAALKGLGINGISKERLEKLRDKRIITDKELNEKYLSVMKFYFDEDKHIWKVGTARIYPSSKKTHVFPYMPLKYRNRGIIEFLHRYRSCILYGDNKTMYTTLSDEQYYQAIQRIETDVCSLCLPDYKSKTMVTLNTLDISGIRSVESL